MALARAALGLAIAAELAAGEGCSSHIRLGAWDEGADASAADAAGIDSAGGRTDSGIIADTALWPDGASGDPCADYANRLCELEQSCNVLIFRNTFWGELSICKERRKLRCSARLNAPGSNDSSARVSACVAALLALTCDTYVARENWPATCDPPAGNLADGAPCGVGAQCRGLGCFPADNSICGSCSTLSPIGAPCNVSCQTDLQCVAGTCLAYLREGDNCRFGGPLCAFGLACLGAGAGQGRCAKRLSAGATCDPMAFECNDSQGLSCDAATSRCQLDPGRPAPGALCVAGLCRADAWCNMTSGRCEAKRREGEACGLALGAPQCLEPALCVAATCTLPNPSACR
jgi:hypothetical protein